MKKFITLFIIISLLTGCDSKNKTVTCNGNMSKNDLTTKVVVVGNFTNDKLKKQNVSMEFDLSNYLQYAPIEEYYQNFTNAYNVYNEKEGITVSLSNTENTITVNMEFDLEKVDKAVLEEFSLQSDYDVSSKAFIKSLTDSSFVCE